MTVGGKLVVLDRAFSRIVLRGCLASSVVGFGSGIVTLLQVLGDRAGADGPF